MKAPVTRRDFLHAFGSVGGSTAVYRAALGLGLMSAGAATARPALSAAGSKPPSVVILGAGMSGLAAAYELDRKGYRVQVLEASHRAGGRNFTVRAGDLIDETGYPQTCAFDADPDLYFNAGPARIPGHHSLLLEYCRTLGVELMPFIGDNRNAWVQDDAMFAGKPVRMREYLSDTRGFIAELMAKSLRPESISAPMTPQDWERMREYVRRFGALNTDSTYVGTSRAGLARHDYMQPEQLKTPLDAHELLKSRFMELMGLGDGDNFAPMLMQAVGGMDQLVKALMREVGHRVQLQTRVEAIRLEPDAVAVTHRHRGERSVVRADYCLNCIPMHLLAGIDHNFPSDYVAAFSAIPRGKLFKVAFQMKERFWEREGIYGGISWTMQDIQQIWYPSHGVHTRKGIVLGAYSFNASASERMARLTPQQRLEFALRQGEKVHPDYRRFVETGVSIAWHRMNHILGCGADWGEELQRRWLPRLMRPQGRHYLIGDQVSYHPGWMEGALSSAAHALVDINARVQSSGKMKS